MANLLGMAYSHCRCWWKITDATLHQTPSLPVPQGLTYSLLLAVHIWDLGDVGFGDLTLSTHALRVFSVVVVLGPAIQSLVSA